MTVDGQCFHKSFTHFGTTEKDLSMENGLITKGARLLIPSTHEEEGTGTDT